VDTIIETVRLTLRPLCLADAEAVHGYSGDAGNTRYITGLPNAAIEETQAYLQWVSHEWCKVAPGYCGFAIMLGGRLIGEVAFGVEPEKTEASIGWIIHRDYWNRGYATEAVAAVIDLCFNSLDIKTIIASCDVDNTASRRVMQKLGMQLKHENEPWEYKDGRVSTGAVYSC